MKYLKKTIVVILVVFLITVSNSGVIYSYGEYIEQCNNKIDPVLFDELYEVDKNESVDISIMFEDEHNCDDIMSTTLTDSSTLDDIHAYRKSKSDYLSAQISETLQDNLDSLDDSIEVQYVSKYAPIVVASAKKSDIYKLSRQSVVDSISFDFDIAEPQLSVSRNVIRANTIQTNSMFGYTGSGVRIGLFESYGVPDRTNPALQNANIIVQPDCPVDNTKHATAVAEVIVSQGASSTAVGIAPNATLYCTGGYTAADNESSLLIQLDWLVANDVDIINCSWSFSWSGSDGQYHKYYNYSIGDRVFDYYSRVYNISIVVSAGNYGSSGVVSPGLAYNVISVANVNDNNTSSISDDVIHSSSSYINSATLESKASKPDISAPGTNINLDNVDRTGTSLSAPHVSGAIALLGEQDPLVLISPSAVKSIITVGVFTSKYAYVPSQRTASSNGSPTASYTQYGAGIISCVGNASIVSNEHYDFGVINNATMRVNQSVTLTANKRVRISLAYDCEIPFNSNNFISYLEDMDNDNYTFLPTIYLVNLNIKVYNSSGTLVASSTTNNNNVEIVDFTPTTSGTYTVRIEKTNANGYSTSFGIAWT